MKHVMQSSTITLLSLLLIFSSSVGANNLADAFSGRSSTTSKLSPAIPKRISQYAGTPIYIQIFKEESTLEIYVLHKNKYQLLKRYSICTYSGGLGPKKTEGDKMSPEGFYQTDIHKLNPNSRYHLSFNIGYPNLYDQTHGYNGSFLMVHGECVSVGCYAMGNRNIEEIYYLTAQALNSGQENINVHIYPFRMTAKNMKRYQRSPHYAFWQQLKVGYDYFEKHKQPPVMTVENKKYKLVSKP